MACRRHLEQRSHRATVRSKRAEVKAAAALLLRLGGWPAVEVNSDRDSHWSQFWPGTGKGSGGQPDLDRVEDEQRRRNTLGGSRARGRQGLGRGASSMAALTSGAQRGNEEGWRHELQALTDSTERRPTAGCRRRRDKVRWSTMAEGAEEGAKQKGAPLPLLDACVCVRDGAGRDERERWGSGESGRARVRIR